MQRGGVLATGLLLGAVADRVLGDPRRFHPVAGFGRVSSWLESRVYADDRARGTGYVAVLVGGSVALGCCVERIVRDPPLAGVVVTAAATWAVLGGRSLAREAESIAASLQAGDIDAARARMPNLVSRDPQALDANGIARATLESVAENTSDAVVAPLLWERSRVSPDSSGTGPSTRWTPWWVTAMSGTSGSVGRRPGWTMWSTGFRRGWPPGWLSWPPRWWAGQRGMGGRRSALRPDSTPAPMAGRLNRPSLACWASRSGVAMSMVASKKTAASSATGPPRNPAIWLGRTGWRWLCPSGPLPSARWGRC